MGYIVNGLEIEVVEKRENDSLLKDYYVKVQELQKKIPIYHQQFI